MALVQPPSEFSEFSEFSKASPSCSELFVPRFSGVALVQPPPEFSEFSEFSEASPSCSELFGGVCISLYGVNSTAFPDAALLVRPSAPMPRPLDSDRTAAALPSW